MTVRTETGVWSLTTGRVPMGIRPAVSLYRRSAAEGMVRTIATCVMSSAAEMHATGSKTSTKNESAQSKNNAMRGTMIIMAPSTTNLTNSAPLKEGKTREESRLSLMT
jgi:hypothetical protein